MKKARSKSKSILLSLLIITITSFVPGKVHGEVKPIIETREKLDGISDEEEGVLQELFLISQEKEEMKRQEVRLTDEIDKLDKDFLLLEREIKDNQEEHDEKLYLLEEVLIAYQRGGPASYLEILLSAEDFSSFLKGMHLIQDISRNTDELLTSLNQVKAFLTDAQDKLQDNIKSQEEKRDELTRAINKHEILQKEQEAKLYALKEEKEVYSEYLRDLEFMWEDLQKIFASIVEDFGKIIRQGNFTMEDLNIEFSLFSVKGAIHEDTFNRIIEENSDLPKIVFSFIEDSLFLEIPERKLVLQGRFLQVGPASIVFQVDNGSFYNMTLERMSIDELFKEGSLIIDFNEIAGDMLIIDINLDSIISKEKHIEFIIKLFPF